MNKSLFILLSTLTMCANSAQKNELHYEPMRPAVFAATHLGQVGVAHNGKDFAVIKDNKAYPVKSYLVDKTLRGKSTQQVAKYLAHHAIEIKEGSDHEFSLEAHNRQLGGGPLTANFLYWGTKTFCYGTAVAAAGTAAVATGGAVMGALAAGATMGASTGAVIVGGAIANSAAAPVALLATETAIGGLGVTGAMVAVESASLAMGALGAACWFLP